MQTKQIIDAIDQQVARLRQAQALLSGGLPPKKQPQSTPTGRTMSAAGRAKISAAQKKRWAKQRKAA